MGLGSMIAKRRNSYIAELPVLLRRKQGVHQLNGMRRKHIRFVPRKSIHVSEGCDLITHAISYPQQPLRPHYSTKRKICTMRPVPPKNMDNSLVTLQLNSPQFGFGRASRLDPAATTYFLSMTRPREHAQYLNHSTASID